MRYFVPIDIHVGSSLANMEGSALANVSTKPGLSLSVFLGMMLRYKDKVGLAAEGGLVTNGYSFSSPTPSALAEYSITNYSFSTKARGFYLIDLKNNKHSVLRLGFGAGYLFNTFAYRQAQVLSLNILSEVQSRTIPFIEPEIGLTKVKGKNQIDLGLTYHYNFAPTNTFTSRLTTPTGSALASSRMNYVALVLRFHPEILRKRKTSPERAKPTIIRAEPKLTDLPEINQRNTRERFTIDLKRKNAVLKFKDNSEIDGDTISVYVNGNPVLIDYGLVKKEKKIRITLEPGANSITVVAKNEGKTPPNTALCRIRSGLTTYRITTITGLKQNEVIKINYVE